MGVCVSTVVCVGVGDVVAVGVCVSATGVGVLGVGEGVVVGSNVTKGGYEISAPGVRYVSAQAIGVSICGRIGSSKANGRADPSPGSMLDRMRAFTLQNGSRRAPICPTMIMRRMPMGIIKMSNAQSRRSRFWVVMIHSPSGFVLEEQ